MTLSPDQKINKNPLAAERKQIAKDSAYGCLLGNNLYYHECCEVLEDLLSEFRELAKKCKINP